MVCPLYFAFATIMPPMNTMAENLINNCRQWEAELIEENTATFRGLVLHELIHALGFTNSQARATRGARNSRRAIIRRAIL